MQSWMQSLDIKQPAEQASQVVASTILIDCSTITAAAAAISSNCSIPTVLTDCSVSTVLDLYRC
jgi:hypothetical protein